VRFSRLLLERYGRFDGCELTFLAGSPDLHVIYGANEAGKTTSLAAVSDLLFGFQTRSPYNFLFDYALLRVGATLEDGDAVLRCRRKKGTSATLLDDADGAIDEAPLAAMLKGQTRETFSLSFSLDQDALRAGGRAMVEARNDVGRALFAAGSGMTGIADELRKLEAEADAIWGPTAAARRGFTQADRQLTEAKRLIRDEALKPRAWSDAQQKAVAAREALEKARSARDAVQSEIRNAERVRRLAPMVRVLDEHRATLLGCAGAANLGKHREDGTETVLREIEDAERKRAAAELLRVEAADRRAQVEVDPEVLALADTIDQLVADAGAVEKGARDLVRLEQDLAVAAATTLRLRKAAGANADATVPRAVASGLREKAGRHVAGVAAGAEIARSRAEIEERRHRAQSDLDAVPEPAAFDALIDAVDAARTLGADADARCDAAARKAGAAAEAMPPLLARLLPWQGTIEALLALPRVGEGEIEAAKSAMSEIAAEIRREEEQARRCDDQAAIAGLAIAQQETGGAISPEEIDAAKDARARDWAPIRDHVLSGGALASPEAAVAGFEASMARVDETMDLRFALADTSSRLLLLEQDKARHGLEAEQARSREQAARARLAERHEAWTARLAAAGLPALAPGPFQTWQADRDSAEATHAALAGLRAEAEALIARRDAVRAAMAAALGQADAVGALAPVLVAGQRKRQGLEDAGRQRQAALTLLRQIATDVAALDRRQAQRDQEAAENGAAWTAALAEVGLQIAIATCGDTLDQLDALRAAVEAEMALHQRIEGIRRDSREHLAQVDAAAARCGVAPGDAAARLRALRERLEAVRSARRLLDALEEEERGRAAQVAEASARLRVAEAELAPLMAETRSSDRAGLAAAIAASRLRREIESEIAAQEGRIVAEGDGLALAELLDATAAIDASEIAGRIDRLNAQLGELNTAADLAATADAEARSAFATLDTGSTSAADAAADAAQARAEIEVLAEQYILKRAQAVTLKWAIEKYRERHQDPLLLRAGALFSVLTTGRYAALRVDADGPSPRLLGMRDDGRTLVEVGAMSEGTTDQLFLALRLAALEQSVAAGINLPFLADDLFVNFDDQRAEAGFKVLAEVARSTQVLFFTHHPHLVAIAKGVVGAESHSECVLA